MHEEASLLNRRKQPRQCASEKPEAPDPKEDGSTEVRFPPFMSADFHYSGVGAERQCRIPFESVSLGPQASGRLGFIQTRCDAPE
jgi:hypothetical protein